MKMKVKTWRNETPEKNDETVNLRNIKDLEISFC